MHIEIRELISVNEDALMASVSVQIDVSIESLILVQAHYILFDRVDLRMVIEGRVLIVTI